MPDLSGYGGGCKGNDMEETVLPASISVCEPCALANFSGAIIEIVSPPFTYIWGNIYLPQALLDLLYKLEY